MNNNAHYWVDRDALSALAETHTKNMTKCYPAEILRSDFDTETLSRSLVRDFSVYLSEAENPAKQYVLQDTTTNAIFRLKPTTEDPVVLNFASYTQPGGFFLEGSKAQEECLCHSSFLFNVLQEQSDYYKWNNAHKNRGLYEHRALYTPQVYFFNKNTDPAQDGIIRITDVITCAAPNKSLLYQYQSFTADENSKVLKERIEFVRDICLEHDKKIVILGAWGCGVFRQDPEEVASLFKEAFKNSGMTIIYAIPDDKTFAVFKRVIG